MESSFAGFMLFVNVRVDILLISVCCVMMARYEMIKRAYENVNSKLNSENNNSKSMNITFFFLWWNRVTVTR